MHISTETTDNRTLINKTTMTTFRHSMLLFVEDVHDYAIKTTENTIFDLLCTFIMKTTGNRPNYRPNAMKINISCTYRHKYHFIIFCARSMTKSDQNWTFMLFLNLTCTIMQ